MKYKELPTTNVPKEIKEDSPLKITILLLVVIIIAIISAFYIVGLTPQSDDCSAQIENATNATMIEAYPLCLEYMQELVLDYKVLPVLLEDGNVTYLNLTEYYDLNDLGGNK
jgi:uncharacterized protein (UPF0333 family)